MNCCATRFPSRTWTLSKSNPPTPRAFTSSARTPTTWSANSSAKRCKQRGKIIIPAFSVGRTQQIVYVLHELACAGKLPRVPIFVDSPLSVNATDIYNRHPEALRTPFMTQCATMKIRLAWKISPTSASAEESKKLNDLHQPMIIISASGMCEGGRIRHHLKNNLGDPKQPGLVHRLLRRWHARQPDCHGQNPGEHFRRTLHDVRAKVVSLDTYSGHADKNELKNYVSETFRRHTKKSSASTARKRNAWHMPKLLRAMKPKAEVIVPQYKQVVEI